MQTFTYHITNLADYRSEAIEVFLEKHEALEFGTCMARELIASMPELKRKGMCITVSDNEGDAISIVPLDTVQ